MVAELDPHDTINSVVTMIGNDKPLFRNVLINNNDVTLMNITNMLSEQLLQGSKEDTENLLTLTGW